MNLCDPQVIKQIMSLGGVSFQHKFGQNFLINQTVPETIAEVCSDDPSSVILEIGPGIGCLTQELAKRYQKVVAVEIDKGLIPLLNITLSEFHNIVIENQDIMKIDIKELLEREVAGLDCSSISVCANLPYYITTPILMKLLESHLDIKHITVMVQKEFAERLLSQPGTSDYGAIAAAVSYYGTVHKCLNVPRTCFMPSPNVDSMVIRIDLYEEKPYKANDEAFFFDVLHAAFEQRRKTLQNAITAKLHHFTKEDVAETLVSMGYPADLRGEKLSCEEFVRFSNLLNSKRK